MSERKKKEKVENADQSSFFSCSPPSILSHLVPRFVAYNDEHGTGAGGDPVLDECADLRGGGKGEVEKSGRRRMSLLTRPPLSLPSPRFSSPPSLVQSTMASHGHPSTRNGPARARLAGLAALPHSGRRSVRAAAGAWEGVPPLYAASAGCHSPASPLSCAWWRRRGGEVEGK